MLGLGGYEYVTGVRNKYKFAYKEEEVEVHHFGT